MVSSISIHNYNITNILFEYTKLNMDRIELEYKINFLCMNLEKKENEE